MKKQLSISWWRRFRTLLNMLVVLGILVSPVPGMTISRAQEPSHDQRYFDDADALSVQKADAFFAANITAEPDRKLLYFARVLDNELVVMEYDTLTGEMHTKLTQHFVDAVEILPALSPGSTRIAVTLIPEDENALWHSEIWVGDLSGSPLQRLVANTMPTVPVWSHDDDRLVFTRLIAMEGVSNRIEIREIGVTSIQEERLVLQNEAMEIHPLFWSQDDTVLYYHEFHNNGDAPVWTLDTTNDTTQVLIPGTLGQLPYDLVLNPRGDQLAFAWVNRESHEFSYEVRTLNLYTGALDSIAQSSYLELWGLHWVSSGASLLFNGANESAGYQTVLMASDNSPGLKEAALLNGTHLLDVYADGQMLIEKDALSDWEVYLIGTDDRKTVVSTSAYPLIYLGSRSLSNSSQISIPEPLGFVVLQLPAGVRPVVSEVKNAVPNSEIMGGDAIVAAAQTEVNNQSHYLIAGHGETGRTNPATKFVSGVKYYCHTYPNRGYCTQHRHFDCVGLVARMFIEQGALDKLSDVEPWTVSYLLNWWVRNKPDRVHRDYNWSGRSPGDPVIVNNGSHVGIYATGDRLINASGDYCSNSGGCSGRGVVNDPLSYWKSGFVAYLDIDWGSTSPPPSCPTSGGVILYKNANYDCGGGGDGSGYVQRSSTGWQNVASSFNDQASSIRVPSGWSVKLYQQSDRGGGWACRTSNDSDFWGDQFSNGVGLNDQVSSFEVFNSPNCGENHSPNTPTLESPPDNHSTQDGRAPTLCWNNAGDPDGDPVQFYAEVYDSPMTTNSGWTSNTCWRPSSLDGHYHTYKWRVRARDNAGSQSEWSNTRRFTIQAPNQPPTIAFNTANGNSASLIESREQNWTFQGTSSDPDGSVNRVELRCSGDNCGSGASQASGTTSWSLARSAMAGRNEVYFQVYDNQGASATSRHLDLRIDLAAPTTGNNLIGTAGNNDWYISPVEVHLHADDGSTGGVRVGVDRVVYRLDGGTWQNRSGSDVSLVINSDGTHTVDYYAVDKVGNTESQKQVTFKIDATPPSAPGTATEIHGVLSGQWQKGLDDPSFIWVAATDTASGIWYYRVNWNNTLQVTQGSAYDPPAVRTGSYELSVQAVDQAGNVGSVGAAFTFRYDGTPPPAPAIQNHDGIASGVWQNSIRTPNFSWPTPTDQGSGVAGYNRYWGPDANGESSTLVTDNTFVSATPICAADEAAMYYLRLRTQDGVGWQSEWVGYALAYDGAPPTGTLIANYGLPVAHQTSVHLDIAASDAGSGVAQMRLSNSGYNWSDWMSPASELYWEIPALGRREHAIYLQLVDGAGNVSDIISDTVYFDVNVPFPKSENFHMWDSLLAAGGGIITSTHLIQRATVGQPSESVALQSAQYLLNPGFQAGALAAPIRVPTYTTHLQLGSLMASATTSATAIASGHYRLYGSLGQPSDMRTVTSTHFTASLGFWGGAARDVTPQPPEPPAPPAPPECEFYSLSINDGALFTRSPLVTLDLCGPDPVQMMLSNDGGFNGTTWQPYTPTISWTLTTYGNYVLPRLVYVRYRDGSNVIHGNFFDDIIYDPNAPEGAVAFDAAALLPGMKLQAASQPLRVTSTPDTELFLSFADDSSGMAEVQISLTPDFAKATWQPYAGIVPVTFAEEGVQTVYVRTRDQAGNASAVVTDTLIVDTTPPIGNVYPYEEVVGPNSLALTLLLPAWDYASDVSDVRISTLENFGNALWQPYAPEVTVPISHTGVAQPMLYAQFRDAAGNVSETYTTTYLVDTTPPVLYVEVSPGNTLTRTLNILVYDDLSRIGEMRLSNDPLFLDDVVTLPYTQTVTWGFDSRRVVWVQIADSVGNRSEPFPAYALEGAMFLDFKTYLPLVIRQ